VHYFGAAFLLWECSTPFGESLLIWHLRGVSCTILIEVMQ